MVASGLIKDIDVHPQAHSPIGSEENETLLQSPVDVNASSETITRFITTTNALGLLDQTPASEMPPEKILSTIANIQQSQNSLDTTKDIAEIRRLMRHVIQAGTDHEILELLQVRDDQMPEAIKSLQRVLEKISAKPAEEAIPPGVVIGTVKRSVTVQETGSGKRVGPKRSRTTVSLESSLSSLESPSGSGGSSGRTRDTLNQEFIETGISALVRMSRGQEINLPSWTITIEGSAGRRRGIGTATDPVATTGRPARDLESAPTRTAAGPPAPPSTLDATTGRGRRPRRPG